MNNIGCCYIDRYTIFLYENTVYSILLDFNFILDFSLWNFLKASKVIVKNRMTLGANKLFLFLKKLLVGTFMSLLKFIQIIFTVYTTKLILKNAKQAFH